jgi:hypothetical protein
MAELPGKDLAQELINQSRTESRKTPMESAIPGTGGSGAIRGGNNDAGSRL